MGDVFKAVTTIFGGGQSKAAATVSDAATKDVVQDKKDTKKKKVALTSAWGARGQELEPSQVGTGDQEKVFGN